MERRHFLLVTSSQLLCPALFAADRCCDRGEETQRLSVSFAQELGKLERESRDLHCGLSELHAEVRMTKAQVVALLSNERELTKRIREVAQGCAALEQPLRELCDAIRVAGERIKILDGKICLARQDVECLNRMLCELHCQLQALRRDIRIGQIKMFIYGLMVGMGIGVGIGGAGGAAGIASVGIW